MSATPFAGYRFPPEIIALAVRWYLRYRLSYADVAELLAERGVRVDPSSIYAWVREFAPLYEAAARSFRRAVSDRWSVDETYVKVAGEWACVYRALDEHGQVVEVYVSTQRATEDAATFFRRAIEATGVAPSEVTTDCAAGVASLLRLFREFDTTGEFGTSAPLRDHEAELADRGEVRTQPTSCCTCHNEFASGIEFRAAWCIGAKSGGQ